MKKKIIFLIQIILVFIIIICILNLLNWFIENKQNSQISEKLLSYYTSEDIIIENTKKKYNIPNINFDELRKSNNEAVGWIKVNNTNINYSIVKTVDNSFYLTHNFNKDYNSAGWIFADYQNNFEILDKNTIIYGHNRRNNTMFAGLKNTLVDTWYKNPENQYICFSTPNTNYIGQIFSIKKIPENDFKAIINFSSEDEFLNYINLLKIQSIFNFDVDINASDNIITLYTCDDNTDYRIILTAKLIEV